jgi:asparagine synthetase B (glutamine-hydrolysing)
MRDDKDLLLEQILLNYDCPVDLGSMIPQFLLSKAISDANFNVAISGDGADELFGGYRRITQYDSQQSDVFDELVHYHLPRLDRLMMANTIELRCPYLSSYVMNIALSLPYSERVNKKHLKNAFRDIVPNEILLRKKEPLKIKDIREDKMSHRLRVIQKFKDTFKQHYLVEG